MRRPAAVGLALLLAGCDAPSPTQTEAAPPRAAPSAPRTVLEFLEDPGGLEAAWTRCRNDPGGIGRTPECSNAGHAQERLMMLGRERAIQSLRN